MSQLNVDTIKKADGTGNLSVPAETGTVVTTASPSLGRRNIILNGSMAVAQRGNQTALTNGFACDRFNVVEGSATAVVNVNKSTDSPDGFSNSMQVDVTTAQASISAAEISYVRYKIEGQDVQHLKYGTASAQSVTLSFWVKSSVTGTYVANLFNNDASKVNRQTYTVSTADTWEYKTITFSGDTSSGFDNDNNVSLSVHWVLATGTNYTGGSLADDTWGSYTASEFAIGQTANVLNDTANNFYITGVQLEVGSVATPFEHRSYGEELALCQRYFWYKGYLNGVPQRFANQLFSNYNSTDAYTSITYPVQMRATPSATASAIGGFSYYSVSGVRTISSFNFQNGDQSAIQIRLTGSGFTAGYAGHLDANSNGYITFDAEL